MDTADDFIPVRALNQVTYCPRLYYLEYVESVMPINEHVEDGLFQHRRIDDPELRQRTRKDGDTLHTRSVQITSERLGISGKLDLVEEKSVRKEWGLARHDAVPVPIFSESSKERSVYPVEYKRGSGPPGDNGLPPFWDNDAVQVCAQGLLLEEELGVPVPLGVLYYIGSKTRVEVPLDEDLRTKTLQAIRTIRELSKQDAPPEPLPAELRHRCFGCSLATICQPEETLYCLSHQHLSPAEESATSGFRVQGPRVRSRRQLVPAEESVTPSPLAGEGRGGGEEPAPGITRVLPQGSEGAVLYLQEPGSHVGKRSEHLIVRKNGEEIQRVPISAINQVVIFGNVQVSTQALECLATLQVPVVYLTGYGRFTFALQPAPTKNVMLRLDQYRVFTDPSRALSLAKAVVKAKISNQRTLLMRFLRSRSPDPCPPAPFADPCPLTPDPCLPTPDPYSLRGSDEPAAKEIAELLTRLDRISDPAVLLGTEGQAAALYFSQFHRMLKAPTPGRGFDFKSRNRRPPRDPVNALLSFAYAILLKDCFSALCTVGFDPYCGFFHAGRHGKPSLALDLMEEFRAIIADSVVLTLINNDSLSPKDFLVWREACQLTEEGRKRFFQAYEQRKATVVTHPVFGYKMAYGRMIEVQARMLGAYVRADIPGYTGFTVR